MEISVEGNTDGRLPRKFLALLVWMPSPHIESLRQQKVYDEVHLADA
ncbi:MAG: hypothetical protein PCFJNLEI_01860 [Verrucomicrobiae bacterium]|nr:hypothetical protein [Verrucomicrobiae bacterium]